MLTPAQIYNDKRRIVFCTANDPAKGFSKAQEYIEGYRRTLGEAGYIGLKAELTFYEKHRKEFCLTVAGDMGEHADFAGSMAGVVTRFDVTTNLSYKSFENYEPFLGDGPEYRIAHIDAKSFDIIEMVSLAFPRCDCGGYMLPYIAMGPENFDSNGDSRWTHDQYLFETCTDCGESLHKDSYVTHFSPPPLEYASDLPDEVNAISARTEYALWCYRYFHQTLTPNIVGLAERCYTITGKDGDGFYAWDFPVVRDYVSSRFHRHPEHGLP